MVGGEVSQAGLRMEYILRRLGFERLSPQYVDAKALEKNLVRARFLAKGAVRRKMEGRKKFSRRLHNSDEAMALYSRALQLDINSSQQFIDFTMLMQRVLDLLGINEKK